MLTNGTQIKAARALVGWSQRDLASAAGLHENAIAAQPARHVRRVRDQRPGPSAGSWGTLQPGESNVNRPHRPANAMGEEYKIPRAGCQRRPGGAAVGPHEIDARPGCGAQPEQAADHGREEDAHPGQHHRRAVRPVATRDDHDDRADRDQRDARGAGASNLGTGRSPVVSRQLRARNRDHSSDHLTG